MSNTYQEKDIRVLGEIEHIQLNAGMYIGDTSNPVHLVEECLDNALDEALAGYSNIIAVIIDTKKFIYTVIDDGRGIPIGNDVPITISTKLFSGAKFQDNKTSYGIVAGMHGIGLVAVCALSEFYIIEIYRDNKYAYYEFKNSKLKTKKIEPFEGKKPFSTKIQFKPSKKIFESLVPDLDRLRNRLIVASTSFPKNKVFVLNVDDKKELFQLTIEEYFKKYCLNSDEATDLIFLKSYKKPESFNIILSWATNGAISPRVMSSVNLLPVDSGGIHVNIIYDILREFFMTKAKKLGYKFSIQDCLVGLRSYLSLSLIEPKFSGQTKDKLTNRKSYLDNLANQLKVQLEKYFTDNKEYLIILLDRFQEYRKRLDSKKLKNLPTGKRASTKFTKLKDCTSRQGELFICEGDSASGTIVQCRDPRIHAILPLKGKIPNIINAKDILKNNEIREIVLALGTGINSDFDIKKLRYDKIICAADSDPDGGHISSLMMMVFAILVPEVIKQGKFYLARTPLFAINEKNIFIPLWSDEEFNKAREENRNISRFKGLGELNPNQLKVCLIDKETRNLIPISFSSKIENLIKLFSDVGEKRNLLSNGELYNE